MLPVNSAPGVATLSSEDKIRVSIYANSCCHTLRGLLRLAPKRPLVVLHFKLYFLSIKATDHRYHDTPQLLR